MRYKYVGTSKSWWRYQMWPKNFQIWPWILTLTPLDRKIHTQNHFHSISRLKIHRNAKNYNDKLIHVCFIRIHAQHTAAHLHNRQFLKNAAYFSLTPNFFLMSGIYRRRLDKVTSWSGDGHELPPRARTINCSAKIQPWIWSILIL